ncbi:MAG TPA: formate/nitrite transporter family protein [Firmicutes bacterium]|nr:formate/nitrite transporter family protein [Bacillota bacterium]
MSNFKAPAVVAETLSKEICVKKATGDWWRIALLGILAGAYIGFGGELATMAGLGVADKLGLGFQKFLMGSVFSVGLMLVVIAGAELFTGNNLMVLAAYEKRTSLGQVLAKWVIVYLANFIGAFFIAYLMYVSKIWESGGWGQFALNIALSKVRLEFWPALFRGIGCNWLVCLAVWMAIASNDVVGKVFAIYFPIMAFVASGFEHIIANFYFIPMGLFLKSADFASTVSGLGDLTIGSMIVKNFIPVTIGNVIGGVFFVATFYFWTYLMKSGKTEECK